MTQTTLTTPRTTNAPRQVTTPIRATTMGGVIAFPPLAKACVTPWAQPRRSFETQYCMARVAVGKVAPSPKPSSRRTPKRLTQPPAKAVRMVATAQISPETVSVRRAPK